ncbi:MAG: hypothetical protein WCW01_02645 [Gammaproteobacteria bacterium]
MQNTQQNPTTTQDIPARIQDLLLKAHYTNPCIRDSAENVLKTLGQLVPLWDKTEEATHKMEVSSILIQINNAFKAIKPKTPHLVLEGSTQPTTAAAPQPKPTLETNPTSTALSAAATLLNEIKIPKTPYQPFWIFIHAISFGNLGKEKVAKIEAEQNLSIALKSLANDITTLNTALPSDVLTTTAPNITITSKKEPTIVPRRVEGIHSKPIGGSYTEKNIFKRIKQAYSSWSRSTKTQEQINQDLGPETTENQNPSWTKSHSSKGKHHTPQNSPPISYL